MNEREKEFWREAFLVAMAKFVTVDTFSPQYVAQLAGEYAKAAIDECRLQMSPAAKRSKP